MIRWNVQYDDKTRRDHLYLGRLKLGFGHGCGPIFSAYFEKGTGVIKTEPADSRGETYRLTGMGLELGYTAGRVTYSLEVSLGEANRYNPDLYGLLGAAVQFRAF